MNVREFFQTVVVLNYNKFDRSPTDFRLLWNALVSMNTVAEHVALERLEYAPGLPRNELGKEAKRIRDQSLEDLKFCAEALKHVRKTQPKIKVRSEFTTIATSTGIDPDDQGTWKVYRRDLGKEYDLVKVVQNAFATLSEIPELK